FSGVLVCAYLLLPNEFDHFRNQSPEIPPKIFGSILTVSWGDEACLVLGVAYSCPLEFGDEAYRRSAPDRSFVDRKIRLTEGRDALQTCPEGFLCPRQLQPHVWFTIGD